MVKCSARFPCYLLFKHLKVLHINKAVDTHGVVVIYKSLATSDGPISEFQKCGEAFGAALHCTWSQ